MLRAAAVLFVVSAIGCTADGDAAFGGGGQGASGQGGSSTASGDVFGDGTGDITIRLRASGAAVEHDANTAGQQPIAFSSGVRSLRLYRDAEDTNPAVIFDLGEESVPVDYAPGADTAVQTVPISGVPRATYTRARVAHAWTRYQVDATLHAAGGPYPGTFDNLIVISDGTRIGDDVFDAGHYEYVFTTAGQEFPTQGENGAIPTYGSGGFEVKIEDGEWAFYFPVNLPVDPDLDTDTAVILEVNTHECFRWIDQNTDGFAAGVFDTTATTPEPVIQLGANSYGVTIE